MIDYCLFWNQISLWGRVGLSLMASCFGHLSSVITERGTWPRYLLSAELNHYTTTNKILWISFRFMICLESHNSKFIFYPKLTGTAQTHKLQIHDSCTGIALWISSKWSLPIPYSCSQTCLWTYKPCTALPGSSPQNQACPCHFHSLRPDSGSKISAHTPVLPGDLPWP